MFQLCRQGYGKSVSVLPAHWATPKLMTQPIALMSIRLQSGTRIRQNFDGECERAINEQINMELTAAYEYLVMTSFAGRDDVALTGLYDFFKDAADEETKHAFLLIEFLNKRGGKFKPAPIQSPAKTEFSSAVEMLQLALELEMKVNASLLNLHSLASDKNDPHLTDFLEENYLDEQVTAAKELSDLITKFSNAGEGLGQVFMDHTLQENCKSQDTTERNLCSPSRYEYTLIFSKRMQLEGCSAFSKLLRKTKTGMLVMFYAPWCGFCKRMKPDYASAATQLKELLHFLLIAISKIWRTFDLPESWNVLVQEQTEASLRSSEGAVSPFASIRLSSLIVLPASSFPPAPDKRTADRNGQVKQAYEGENTLDAIVRFMRDPSAAPTKAPGGQEPAWSEEPSEVVHLTEATFNEFVQSNPSVLVMFYAPWCGHCKKMKPQFVEAAAAMKSEGIPGVLAAVDATVEKELGKRFEVKGYPTIKYFQDGEFAFNAPDAREKKTILDFMKDPKEPPPPPPPEPVWSEVESNVLHLTDDDYRAVLKRKKHVLVMFYAPSAQELQSPHRIAQLHHNWNELLDTDYDHENEVEGAGQHPDPELLVDVVSPGVEADEEVPMQPWAGCPHCKSAKPEVSAAAEHFKDNPKVALAAVDCTVEKATCERFKIKGYPAFKYFQYYDKAQEDYNRGRTAADFVAFLNRFVATSPTDDPEPPSVPGEPKAEEMAETGQTPVSNGAPQTQGKTAPVTPQEYWGIPGGHVVRKLTSTNWDAELRGRDAIVFFYVSWCGFCRQYKFPFASAAESYYQSGGNSLLWVAIDGERSPEIISRLKIEGYPTVAYFGNGQLVENYTVGEMRLRQWTTRGELYGRGNETSAM
ncbi:unnamed protein product, partial [Cyprideis torosa]